MVNSKINLAIFVLLLAGLFSCSTPSPEDTSFEVAFKGALKNIMHKGDLSANISLSELADIDHLYALGAVENLKGEI